MELPKEKLYEIIAYEGFLRRAAQLDLPFMLKGSYVTRQYFADPEDRIPNDLDWLYFHSLEDPADVQKKFDEWIIQVTELEVNDGVRFRSFRENAFWRMIDYAMADDFPTTNTDIKCWVHGEELDLQLDVSFNLDITVPPVALEYKPFLGEPFTVPFTTPLPLQVSWKLHQSLVNLRFKDLFDLIHLARHPAFTADMFPVTLQALLEECKADNVDPLRLHYLLAGDLNKFSSLSYYRKEWINWRHNIPSYFHDWSFTDPQRLPPDLDRLMELFSEEMSRSGFTNYVSQHLPLPVEKTPAPQVFNKTPPVMAPLPKKDLLYYLKRLFK